MISAYFLIDDADALDARMAANELARHIHSEPFRGYNKSMHSSMSRIFGNVQLSPFNVVLQSGYNFDGGRQFQTGETEEVSRRLVQLGWGADSKEIKRMQSRRELKQSSSSWDLDILDTGGYKGSSIPRLASRSSIVNRHGRARQW